jgi:hypothetical protein
MKYLKKALIPATLLLWFLFFLTAFSKSSFKKKCEKAKSHADDAYYYFKKAYNADLLADVRSYAEKGMIESSDAEDEADSKECSCDEAKNSASEAYSFGTKAQFSSDLSEAREYAKKAMNRSEEITEEAEYCEKE